MAEDATTPNVTPTGGRTAAEYRAIADSLRARVDLFGKALASLATLGTTAVGLSRISDLYPTSDELLVYITCAALAAAAGAAIWVAVRLMKVGRPVFMTADPGDSGAEVDSSERKEVQPVFEQAARRFGYSSLVGLQERERSLRHAAAHATDKDERTRRTGLADEVKTEIEQALARAQVIVIRRRATRAVSDRGAWGLYAVVIIGLVVFALGADKASSEREDKVATAKACGEARKAGATASELGRTGVCEGKGETAAEKPKPPSAAQARVAIAKQLSDALEYCAGLAKQPGNQQSDPLEDGDCDPVRVAIVAMNRSSR